jgi:hypothetical protein
MRAVLSKEKSERDGISRWTEIHRGWNAGVRIVITATAEVSTSEGDGGWLGHRRLQALFCSPFSPSLNSAPRWKVDKFRTFGLTALPAAHVNAPLIDECYASLECRVTDTRMAAKYNLFILEVLKAWVDPSRRNPRTIHHLERGSFMVAGRTIRLPSKKK